jgi:rare lipoprotein A
MKISISALLAALIATTALAQAPTAPVAPAAPAAPVTPVTAPAAVAAPAAEKKAVVVAAAAAAGDVTTGKAAWYGKKFNGRKTASGQRFNAGLLTAASNTLPFGTLVKVTNLKNKKSVTVRINDRGPKQADRIIDVTRAAAARLGMLKSGLAEVELKVVGSAKGKRMGMGKAKKMKAAKKV